MSMFVKLLSMPYYHRKPKIASKPSPQSAGPPAI
ncbi:hypothetical protein A2U01_0115394, partial [Trifolium medium]|nr:hypothetical protein [Trifolium medium]